MSTLKIPALALFIALALAGFLQVLYGVEPSKNATNSSGTVLRINEPLAKSESSVDVARLLTQASFGPTHASMAKAASYDTAEAWIDAQINLPQTLQLPKVQALGHASFRPPRHYIWWNTAVSAEDQLRQRVAFALSEIFVVSDIDYTLGNAQHGVVHYYDMLATSAFGNFRTLLEDITLHPVMGIYLSMVRNEKADPANNIRPDENYAREIMQLFTIGLYELDEGGQPIPTGNPAPSYTQSDVEEYARVFTGWNFADSPEWQSNNLTQYDKITPMVPQEAFHDKGSKRLLRGVVTPEGLSAREDLKIALDSLFNHPNVGPFIGKSLIQRLVTSNPSSQYVARVAAKFNDNGSGVRGDLSAVVKAILLDSEARQDPNTADKTTVQNFGKLKEPLLRVTHIMRALDATPGVNSDSQLHMYSKTNDAVNVLLGQAVLSSPSVFNFFTPDFRSSYTLSGDEQTPLYAPELQILTESLLSATNNDLHAMLYDSNNRRNKVGRSVILDIEAPIKILREGRDVFLEHVNMLFMSGGMSDNMMHVLAGYINESVGIGNANTQGLRSGANVKASKALTIEANSTVNQLLANADEELAESIVVDSLFMILASPEFMVQR